MACVGEPTSVRSADAGITLVEVLVALSLMAGLLASAVPLVLGTIDTQSGLQRRQQASAIAQSVLERAQAAKVVATARGCVPLLRGRTEDIVDAQWASTPDHVDLSTTDKAFAPAECGTDVVVPTAGITEQVTDDQVTPAITQSGQGFVVRTWVGTCAMLTDGTECIKKAAAPAESPTMYRVVVSVEWEHSGCGADSRCSVSNSMLLDPSADPVFFAVNNHALTALNDAYCTALDTPLLLNVTANDTGSLTTTPVVVTDAPTSGALTNSLATGVGGYVPNTGFSGTDSLKYKLIGPSGDESGEATVNIMVQSACS